MSKERLIREGRLHNLEISARRRELRIKGLVDGVRLALDPDEDVADLEIDVAHEQMVELLGLWAEYREILGRIRSIKKDLGLE